MPPAEHAPIHWSRAGLVLGAACAVLAIHAATYLPFLCDDALISLRYSQRLLDGHGLTWTPGDPVEGYSNLLWVLACAGLGYLGLDLIDAARLLGFLGMSAAIAAVLALRPPRRGEAWLPSAIGPLVLALAPPIAVWTIGGLAPPLVLALLGWATVLTIAAIERQRASGPAVGAGLLLALLAITRVDGPLFAATSVLAVLLVARPVGRAVRVALPILVLPLMAWAGQVAFRLAYYGDWVPNTAYVKAELSAERMMDGLLEYTLPALLFLLGAVVLALPGVWATIRQSARRSHGVVPLVHGVLWTGYVTIVGGDYMPAWRHHCVGLLVAAFLAAIGAVYVTRARATHSKAHRMFWGSMLLALVLGQLVDGNSSRARTERWEWDAAPVGRFLRTAFAEQQPLVAVEAAGCLPYFSMLPCLDMLGLNDRHIARQPADTSFPIGHDHGDGDYVLDRQPDLIVYVFYGLGLRGNGVSAEQTLTDSRFITGYRAVTFETPEPDVQQSRMWVRLVGAAGVRHDEGGVWVPAYLFGSLDPMRLGPDAQATIDRWLSRAQLAGVLLEDGSVGAELRDASPQILHGLELEDGRWHLEVEPAGTGIELSVLGVDGAALPRDDDGAVTLPAGARVSLQVDGTTPIPIPFRGVRLRRVPP